MVRRLLVAALLGGLIPLGACEQQIGPPVELKRDKHRPPPPLPEPVDPTLPPFYLDDFASPVRAAGTIEGRLLVTDTRHRMILRVDPVSLRPDQGLRVGYQPSAVALLGAKIYVGNPDRATVDVYAAQGGGSLGNLGVGAVGYASDIAVDVAQGLLFVADGQARDVKVFDSTGALVRLIGQPGTGAGQFVTPIGIAVDTAAQEVLVSDYGSPPGVAASVRIFAYDGTYLDAISGAGTCGMLGCSGGFSRPQGLAVSRLGKVFLADALLGQVLVYDRVTRTQARVIGGYPTLHVPSDVVIGRNDDLLVVSQLTASVVLFAGEASR